MFALRNVSRRVFAGMALIGAATPCLAQDVVEVVLDRAKIVDMPAGASTIVIGNPGVADVALLKRQARLVLTARSYGETNVIALDANGATLSEMIVRVKGADHALIVQRGLERETYACNPRCEPVINLGDAPHHMSGAIGQAGQRNAFAGAGAPAAK